VRGEAAHRPAAAEPLIQPHVHAASHQGPGNQPDRAGVRRNSIPVPEYDVAIEPGAEAVQVEQQHSRECGEQPCDDGVKRPVEWLVSQLDPTADLGRCERPAVDRPAERHPGGDDAGPEPAVLFPGRIAVDVGDEPAERRDDRGDPELGQKCVELPGQPVRPQDVWADRKLPRELGRIVKSAVRQARGNGYWRAARLDYPRVDKAESTRQPQTGQPPPWRLAVTKHGTSVSELLRWYRPRDSAEAADVERVATLAEACENPWSRSLPLHLTASALVVHPDSGRVLLRWHSRQQAWLQVGGHADSGERDALMIALREAAEETGLKDLTPWPDAVLRQVVIVPVPAASDEPEHEHADLRFVFATSGPSAIRAERPDAPMRWLSPAEAAALTREDNLREMLSRVENLLRS